MTLRIGIVGAGEIANVHVQAINKTNAELVGICDRYSTLAERVGLASNSEPKAYADFDHMLADANLDVLHVCAPPNAHYPLAKQALEAKVNVLVEKPFTVQPEHAAELYAIAEANSVQICPMYNHLFDKAYLKMKELIESGVIGKVVSAEACYGFNLGGERSKYNLKGSAHWVFQTKGAHLQNVGPHSMSMLLDTIGVNELEISGIHISNPNFTEEEKQNTASTEYRALMNNGDTPGTFTVTLNTKPYQIFLRISGTQATIYYDNSNWEYFLEKVGEVGPNQIARAWNNIRNGSKRVFSTFGAAGGMLMGNLSHFDGLWELVSLYYSSIEAGTEPPVSKDLNLAIVNSLAQIGEAE